MTSHPLRRGVRQHLRPALPVPRLPRLRQLRRLRRSTVALTAVAVAVAGLQTQIAHAATCPAPGGAVIANAPAPAGSQFAAYGRGYGHNLGMSQYGAEGAARLGCTASQILSTYYTGTHVASPALQSQVMLVLLNTDPNGNASLTAQSGTIEWVSTSVTPNVVVVQPALSTWTVVRAAVGESVKDSTGKVVLAAPGELRALEAAQNNGAVNVARVRAFGGAGGTTLATDLQLKWDYTKFASGPAGMKIWQVIMPTATVSGIDKYLWGLGEVPVTWPDAALQAQAIAARTYLVNGYWSATSGAYVIGTTPASQNYSGYAKEVQDAAAGGHWSSAVNATAGQVVVDSAGAPIAAVYNSSDGGRSEDARYAWGGAGDSYLQPVDDSVWDLASDDPNRSWTKGLSTAQLAADLGLTTVTSVSVGAPFTTGRLSGVHVTGTSGGTPVSATYTGSQMAAMLGTLSPSMTFAFLNVDTAPPVASASAGPGATFHWSAVDPAPSSGLAPFTVTITHGGVVDFSGPTTATGMTLVGTPGTTYTLTVVAADNAGHTSAPVTATVTVPLSGTYHPLTPTRMIDSRSGLGFTGPLASRSSVVVPVASSAGPVPANATAVVLNVTATGSALPGFLSVGPVATTAVSNINYGAGQTIATLVTAQLGAGGTVTVTNAGGPVQVVADVQGYFTADTSGAVYVPLTPTRLVDTRVGKGIAAPIGAAGSAAVQVAGAAGVPLGATAVVVNLTAVSPTGPGFLSAGPAASTKTSVLNFATGGTVANLVMAQLSPTGTLTLSNGASTPVNVIADVQGYLVQGTSGASFNPVAPARALDTRTSGPALGPGASRTVAIAGVPGSAVPAGASAAVLAVTAVDPGDIGFLSVGPTASTTTSNVNFPAHQSVANAVIAQLSGTGTVTVTNGSTAATHVLVDVLGYFMG